ncbi:NAD(P)H-dependent glycerol-3-phosphate dehydrogenase [Novosphingobium sp. KACC 22771]|uniref:NAD(P)H-dependent glycerol-3-phosphate dehydrogenase n=1 Tax=Novosphingobium sp. KACC 22771 TaxID=3025670 RepID=UPI002366F493|nr:NAD(P)H-dependent glycerol-3-phosphate dehydrogenase [Novosphingobium sp. KACC 22771]WDF73308.1 NAD(P)-dependent glycerol-3-phosphate dehydrogenase [Novosphingobium sp. KACC 22771]
MSAVGIIGAGAWGTALAQMVASDGTPAILWAREAALVEEINTRRTNATYLPGATIAKPVRATCDMGELADLSTILVVCPAQFMGGVLAGLPDGAHDVQRDLVLCSKGIEAGTGRLMADVAAAIQPSAQIAVMSGPTFAREVAMGLPTAITLACAGGEEQWRRLSPVIARAAFRPYYSPDVVGAEIGGAVKNVLAIACGVVEGLGLGENARAALIARGYAEMLRFGVARGARAETLSGLCGLGDLILTCASTASRNYSLGKALGQGQSASEALSGKSSVAEGAHTAPVLADLARRAGIAMPIVDAVCRLLTGKAPAGAVVSDLLARPLKAELADPSEPGDDTPAHGSFA